MISNIVSYQHTSARKKAELITQGKIYIPDQIKLPIPYDRSTAGPNAGSKTIAFSFDNKNIKLEVSKNQDEIFKLQEHNGIMNIKKYKDIFLENVHLLPTILHAPYQAFINLKNRCIYNCAFCSLSHEKQDFLQKYNREKYVKLLLKTSDRNNLQAIALTSGIYPDNKTIIKIMCDIIQEVTEKIPSIPIGVEPCIFEKNEIILLKKAGADEIKINLQITDEKLFKKICPSFEYHTTLSMLKEAVSIFGKGNVTSNLIFGLGESDESVIKIIDLLASMGVVSNLRKLRVNDVNIDKLNKSLPGKIPSTSTDRILHLAMEQKKILQKYNLTTKSCTTMCHPCGCCDLVPFWDI
jgi:biotin synthase-related radical SAM superfamily protein